MVVVGAKRKPKPNAMEGEGEGSDRLSKFSAGEKTFKLPCRPLNVSSLARLFKFDPTSIVVVDEVSHQAYLADDTMKVKSSCLPRQNRTVLKASRYLRLHLLVFKLASGRVSRK